MNISVEVSIGEFLDKMAILSIKSERIEDTKKLENVNHELSILKQTWERSGFPEAEITEELEELKAINEKIWDIEDQIRLKEAAKDFDQEFIELARSVYYSNDMRAAIKRTINSKLGSELVEEKSYADYQKSS